MSLLQRYLLGRLVRPVLLAVLALIGIALLRQSLQALDIIVDQRQTAGVFIQVIALAMPSLVTMILPIGLLIGMLTALNRLQADQEVVAAYAAGADRNQVAAPAFALALIAAFASLAVNLWVQPPANRYMRELVQDARSDLATALVRQGTFSQPGEGFTIYVGSIDDQGVLHDIFINQENTATGEARTYQAREGRLTGGATKPALQLTDGTAQVLRNGAVTTFIAREFPLDLSVFTRGEGGITYEPSDRYLSELFNPDLSKAWERDNRLALLAEGHSRLASPLYNLTFAALALAAVLGGGFSRLGYGRRIAAASAVAALTRITGFGVLAACGEQAGLNILQYLIPLAGLAGGLWVAFGGRVPWPRRRRAAMAGAAA